MKRKIKQYKPIRFGDGPAPDTVEGHSLAIEDREPIACPAGLALWLVYRERHPNGLTSPPECLRK